MFRLERQIARNCFLMRQPIFMRCAGKRESVSGLAHYSQFFDKLARHEAGINPKVRADSRNRSRRRQSALISANWRKCADCRRRLQVCGSLNPPWKLLPTVQTAASPVSSVRMQMAFSMKLIGKRNTNCFRRISLAELSL